ncbi:Conserved_hypothetical protein [Hexamita inflata]|uniref:Uncharacterized protein n=1 Tax=Hexamita inflata TaxID=28002 RepID=A0AA86TWL9_9EUKA|nr:Conserved hypothetical protein [Hexamita inflata]
MSKVSVQFRFSGDQLCGLISKTDKFELDFKECNISGYFTGSQKANIICVVTEQTIIYAQSISVCTNEALSVYQGINLVQITGSITEDCTLCSASYYAYGLCLQSLTNGVIQSTSLVCQNSFIFDGQNCVCPEDQIQNRSECFDILNAMSKIVDKNNILGFQIGTNQNPDILSVGQRFQNNITALNDATNKDINAINNSLHGINQSIDAQQPISNNIQTQTSQLNNKVQDFISRINCNRQYGYSWQNGQCSLLSCSVEGQAAINGVCQCPGMYQYVFNNKCVCPENSAVIAGACSCTITGQILLNQVCVCTTNNAIVVNGACSCGVYGLNSSNTCSCPVNSNIVVDTCTCNIIYGQSMIDGSCQCASPQTMVDGKCKFVVNSADSDLVCSQQLYVTSFDILEITNTINGVADFSSGYVFSTANVITNAFLNIVDEVYQLSSQLSPLFQSQSTFTNIKIQICSQLTINGAFMTPATIIEINQMYIFSKLETQFSVMSILYLIEATYTSASNHNINNLAINLNISALLGNFTLINSITGPLTIKNYSAKGSYNSQATFTFLGITVQSSTVVVTNISIESVHQVSGNSSSYLISSANTCTISISYMSVIIGKSTIQNILSYITSTSSKYFQFGGYVSYLVSTTLQATNLIYYGNNYVGTDYIKYSGFLVGWSNSNANKIVIQSLCFYSSVTDSGTSNFYQFGLVGQNNGNISMQQAQIELKLSIYYANVTGVIASLSVNTAQSETINVIAKVTSQFASRGLSGSILGYSEGQNFLVQNCTVQSSSIIAKAYVGGVIGGMIGQLSILNTSVKNTYLKASDNSTGGFIGWSSDSHVTINNSSISKISIDCSSNVGMILGRNYQSSVTFTLTNSWSSDVNLINSNQLQNCASFTNAAVQKGC